MENKPNRVYHTFKPIIYSDTKILILGSIPSILSRKQDFYYMNKTNRFYKVMSIIFNDLDFLSIDINVKINALKRHQLGLYDVISECDIINSSDATISNIKVNDLDLLIKKYNIRYVVLNGKKAFELFNKYFSNLNVNVLSMPSTSAANASYSLEKLINHWQELSNL